MVRKFSVCLPVRNGFPYVRECVESILQQTYPNFELHILDNQSTDNTIPWLKELNDPRVKIGSSSAPLSIVDSWARIKNIEKQEFMTLIGHDDILEPNFLAVINALIDDNPDAGLYLTGGRLIDSDGKTLRSCRKVPESETAVDYLKARFTSQRDIFGTGYVMRSADYDRIGGIPHFEKLFFADDALWLSLLQGTYKATDPSEHFAIRIHSKSESASLPSVWPSILKGLGQFYEFLQSYKESDAEAKEVIEASAPNFMLTYHQNAYILALVEASLVGQKISSEIIDSVQSSLATCAFSVKNELRHSMKLKVIEAINALPLRKIIPFLWEGYRCLKNKV